MAEIDVAILTDARYENPSAPDWYARQVLHEDGLVQSALQRRGLRTVRVDWANPDFDWSNTRAALFRTTWDYFERIDEFIAWLDRVEPVTRLVNPASLVRWNMRKRYLDDLCSRGVRVVATHFVEQGCGESLATVLARTGWDQAVLKPVVSGAARETYRITPDDTGELDTRFRKLVAAEAMMLQPFQHAIVDDGELSLMVIGGRFTHAVRKQARPGDFRVQDDHGGTVGGHDATPEQIAFAEAATAACSPVPLYARVDVVRDNDGFLALMELELIEPEMFFRLHPPAAEEMAVAVQTYLWSDIQ
jgi:glutathione synthase/RimK-type ligase-like ATP-grasp enzyme